MDFNIEFKEVYNPVTIYFLVLGIIYDLFNKNYIFNIIFLFNFYSLILLINIIGLYLLLNKLKINISFKISINY